MPVAAPADKRFRRAHVSPARRVTLRDLWPRLVRIGVAGALVVAVLYFVTDRVLSAESLISTASRRICPLMTGTSLAQMV